MQDFFKYRPRHEPHPWSILVDRVIARSVLKLALSGASCLDQVLTYIGKRAPGHYSNPRFTEFSLQKVDLVHNPGQRQTRLQLQGSTSSRASKGNENASNGNDSGDDMNNEDTHDPSYEDQGHKAPQTRQSGGKNQDQSPKKTSPAKTTRPPVASRKKKPTIQKSSTHTQEWRSSPPDPFPYPDVYEPPSSLTDKGFVLDEDGKEKLIDLQVGAIPFWREGTLGETLVEFVDVVLHDMRNNTRLVCVLFLLLKRPDEVTDK